MEQAGYLRKPVSLWQIVIIGYIDRHLSAPNESGGTLAVGARNSQRIANAIARFFFALTVAATATAEPVDKPKDRTGLRFIEAPEEVRQSYAWSLRELTNNTVTLRGRRTDNTDKNAETVPPGSYWLHLGATGQPDIRYGRVHIERGQVADVSLHSGLDLRELLAELDPLTKFSVFDTQGSEILKRSRPQFVPLQPGKYRLHVQNDTLDLWSGTPIEVPSANAARPSPADLGISQPEFAQSEFEVTGFNVASAALGGKVASFSSQYNDNAWAANRLIDGFTLLLDDSRQDNCNYSCGWQSARGAVGPHEIIFSFHENRLATLHAVILHPASEANTTDNTSGVPQHVEIWISDSGSDGSYHKLIERRLRRSTDAQMIELPRESRARFLKLRLLSTYGAEEASLGEVEIIEDAQHSILGGVERDLAQVENGGALVWFTSQNGYHRAAHTVWPNGRNSGSPWHSGNGPYGRADSRPQEFVYAFSEDRVALVDRLVIDVDDRILAADRTDLRASLAKSVAVEASLNSPLEGFEEIARFELGAQAQPQSFPLGRMARFLKLRILSTHGVGDRARLGTVRIIEGDHPDLDSVLYSHTSSSTQTAPQWNSPPANVPHAQAQEAEPNDSKSQANLLALDRWTGGIIDPLGEQDFYKITIDSSTPTVLTIHIRGFPLIRSSLSVAPGKGEPIYHSGTEIATSAEETISLQVDPGEVYLQMSRPMDTFVLVWDTSGSMNNSTEKLENAVLGFIDRVQPSERLGLIRFSGRVEQLLPAFSGDVEELRAAAAGQFSANGGTNLYDAIASALDQLKDVPGNRAIILLTDGQNSSSRMTHEAIWHRLGEDHVPIYAIGLGAGLHHYNALIGTDGWRFLRHLSNATGGLAFRADTAEDLAPIYEAIGQAVRAPSHYQIKPTLSPGLGLLEIRSVGPLLNVASASQFEIILDASGSMSSPRKLINGKRKIDVAKETLREFIDTLPADTEAGLRLFGHRIREYEPGDCQDTELVHHVGHLNRGAMHAAIDSVRAEAGTTPLAYSLLQAAKDFINHDSKRLLILITDGEEYCGADPVNVAATLQKLGFPVQIEVVGLALGGGAVEEGMRALAEVSGGRYHRADDAHSFLEALRSALGLRYEVRDAAGKFVASGDIDGSSLELPEGQYTVVLAQQNHSLSIKDVVIKAQHATRVQLQQEGRNIASAVAPPVPAQLEDWDPGKARTIKAQQQDKLSSEQRRLLRDRLNQLEKEVIDAVIHRPPPQR